MIIMAEMDGMALLVAVPWTRNAMKCYPFVSPAEATIAPTTGRQEGRTDAEQRDSLVNFCMSGR